VQFSIGSAKLQTTHVQFFFFPSRFSNLLAEITILTIGFFIGILDPSIQEFCLLAVMGLLSDFFVQTFFVAAVLAVDMNRVELHDAVRRRVMSASNPTAAAQEARRRINRKKKHFQHPISGPGVIGTVANQTPTGQGLHGSVLAPTIVGDEDDEAKRVRFLNFWAKHRILQRVFIVAMIAWMSFFVYRTTLLETMLPNSEDSSGFVVEGDALRLAKHLEGERKQVKCWSVGLHSRCSS